jgi:hypothetical protein
MRAVPTGARWLGLWRRAGGPLRRELVRVQLAGETQVVIRRCVVGTVASTSMPMDISATLPHAIAGTVADGVTRPRGSDGCTAVGVASQNWIRPLLTLRYPCGPGIWSMHGSEAYCSGCLEPGSSLVGHTTSALTGASGPNTRVRRILGAGECAQGRHTRARGSVDHRQVNSGGIASAEFVRHAVRPAHEDQAHPWAR